MNLPGNGDKEEELHIKGNSQLNIKIFCRNLKKNKQTWKQKNLLQVGYL